MFEACLSAKTKWGIESFFCIYDGGAAKQALHKVKITNCAAKQDKLATLPHSRYAKN